MTGNAVHVVYTPAKLPSLFFKDKPISLDRCNHAGIVFNPQYFALVNELIEDWFADALGVGLAELNDVRRLAIPTAHIDCDFFRPSRLGETLRMTLRVLEVGRSSINIEVTAGVEDEDRLVANLTLVMTSWDTDRPAPIPADIRLRLTGWSAPLLEE